MENYKNINTIDTMERISRRQFGDNIDEIIEKADKENRGFVITDKGKDDIVLMPAKWFSFQVDDDFGCIINSAVRYAIGRHTYMPGVVRDFVKRYLEILDLKTIEVMIDDITSELKFGIDQEDLWVKFRSELMERKNIIEKHETQIYD